MLLGVVHSVSVFDDPKSDEALWGGLTRWLDSFWKATQPVLLLFDGPSVVQLCSALARLPDELLPPRQVRMP